MNRLAKLSFARFSQKVILLILCLTLILLGIDLLLRASEARAFLGQFFTWVSLDQMDPVMQIILGGFALVLPLLYYIASSVARRMEEGVVGRGNDGQDICLTPESVERTVIREVKAQVEEVVRIRSCSAVQGRKAPRISLRVDISDRAQVPKVQQKIRTVVTETLERLIGFADGKQVRVLVTSVQGASGSSAGPRPKKTKKLTSEESA